MTAALIASAKKITPAIASLISHSCDVHQALRESCCSCCTCSGSRRIRDGRAWMDGRRIFERLITRTLVRARALPLGYPDKAVLISAAEIVYGVRREVGRQGALWLRPR